MFTDKVILVVDDARTEYKTIRTYLEHEFPDSEVLGVSGCKGLTQVLAERIPDLAVVALPLAWGQLHDVLKRMTFRPECPIVFVPDAENVPAVVNDMRPGLDDCVVRPIAKAMQSAEGEDNPFLKLLEFAVMRGLLSTETPSLQGMDVTTPERSAHDQHVNQVYLMGKLTSTVAHDFNNLLTIIHGYGHLAIQELLDDGEVSKVVRYLEKIEEKTVLGGSLINKIMQFAHKPNSEAVALNLKSVVADMKDMLRGVVGEGIEFVVDLTDDEVPIRIDPKALELVLMNLVDNACDAMHGQGKLTIQVSQREVSSEEAATLHIAPGNYASLSISDTGVGMDQSTVENIFDAFFTTKKLGVGTGLGLASVHSCVREHGGVIFVRSEPGKGSTFEILWPRYDSTLQHSLGEASP